MHPGKPNCLPGKVSLLTVATLLVLFTNVINSQEYQPGSVVSPEPDSILTEIWEQENSKWVWDSKRNFLYDSNHHVRSEITSGWNFLTSVWIPIAKTDKYYDASGRDTLVVYSNWEKTLKKWIESFKTWNTYDNHGNNTLIVNKRFDEEFMEWIYSDKKEKSFDENGKDTLDIHYTWDVHTLWTASFKTKYLYDENGNNSLSLTYSWDQTDFNKWIIYTKSEHAFDQNGKVVLSLSYSWDPSTSQWRPDNKYEAVFDENGNIITDSLCYQNLGQWIGISKSKYTNNAEGAATIILTYVWSESSNKWLSSVKITYFYPARHVSKVSGIIDHNINVYPNPAREFVTFKLPATSLSAIIEIWDTEGRKIREEVLPDDKTININSLAKGMYICKIIQERRVYTCKILISGD